MASFKNNLGSVLESLGIELQALGNKTLIGNEVLRAIIEEKFEPEIEMLVLITNTIQDHITGEQLLPHSIPPPKRHHYNYKLDRIFPNISREEKSKYETLKDLQTLAKALKETQLKGASSRDAGGMYVISSSDLKDKKALEINLQIPEHISDKEAIELIKEAVSQFDDAYRSIGGSGLKVRKLQFQDFNVLEPA